MRFTLVSTKGPATKRQIEVPDAIIVKKFAAGRKKKPNKKKSIKKKSIKRKPSKKSTINKKIQQTNPIIRKHGSIHHRH